MRRTPKQLRSRQTFDVILQSVVRILKREGVDAVTTNHVAEVAGVSIGSVYQYFPDKQAIFIALHEQHAEEMVRLVDRTVVANAGLRLEPSLRALVETLIDAHTADPELFALLSAEVPSRSASSHAWDTHLRSALRIVLGSHVEKHELDRVLFVITHMLDALTHAAVLARPARLSLQAAKEEILRAIMAYLRS